MVQSSGKNAGVNGSRRSVEERIEDIMNRVREVAETSAYTGVPAWCGYNTIAVEVRRLAMSGQQAEVPDDQFREHEHGNPFREGPGGRHLVQSSRRIRIVNETGWAKDTKVLDAETGEDIFGVLAVDMHLERDRTDVTIRLLAEMDVVFDGEIVRQRLDGRTGRLVEVSRFEEDV